MQDLSYQVITGEAIRDYITDVSAFRLHNFREFPYLYQGNLQYEKKYTEAYSKHEQALLVLVFSGVELVAISTGLPLLSDVEIVTSLSKSVSTFGKTASNYFYFAETIIAKSYRGQGIYSEIINKREQQASQWGFKYGCFLTVVRSDDHPLRPKDYFDPGIIFRKKGYTRTDITTTFEWPTLQANGSVMIQSNVLVLWEKVL